MRRNKTIDCIIAALISVIVTGVSIYIIWAAATILKKISEIIG